MSVLNVLPHQVFKQPSEVGTIIACVSAQWGHMTWILREWPRLELRQAVLKSMFLIVTLLHSILYCIITL